MCVSGEGVYLVRLLTYLPGETVETMPYTSHLIYQLGQTLARFNDALQVISVKLFVYHILDRV